METMRKSVSATARPRSTPIGRRRALAAVAAVVAGSVAWGVAAPVTPVQAAGETIISTFYVPLFEDNARAALFSVNGGTGTALSSTTSVTIGTEGELVYYDHWEDGYEPAANNKTQGSTLVLGDGNTANGDASNYCVPARCAGDYMPAGAVLRLNNSTTVVPGSLTTPRNSATVVFDGRDKLSATGGLTVTHATWPTAIDALHSEMAAAFDTSRWGINFRAPVGTNTPAQGSGTTSFSYSGIEVMAAEAGTSVSVDANNDGDFLDANDVNGTVIGEGQTIYVNGNVQQGARVVASKPVQVFMMTGVIGSNYENRSFQIFPTEGLVNDYVAPASTARPSGTPSYATVLYIFNPQTTAITVNVETPSGTTAYNVPAGSILNPAPFLPYNEAARITSASTFAVVAGSGTREISSQSLNYDWGYSPLPARLIVDDLSIGWAPGSQNLSAAGYDPLWVTTVAPTTLYVDYDGDPATGAFVDPNGLRYDTTYNFATALAMQRVTDPNDNDMTGARIYTIDGTGIAAAHGEDPATTTPVAFPGVDLGTTQFPSCGALCVNKTASLAVDVDGDGLVDPGDTIRWEVTATNTDYYVLVLPVLLDSLPPDVTYVPGSSTVQINNNPVIGVADDSVPPAATLFPYDESGKSIVANIPVGSQVKVTFETTVDDNYGGSGALCNKAVITSVRQTILTPANGADTGCVPIDGLRVTKTSSSGGNPVQPGQNLTYTMTVTNAAGDTVTGVEVKDILPPGLTWVSTSVTAPIDTSATYADDFQTAGSWSGSTGTAPWSATAWAETDTGGLGTGSGFLRKETDLGDLSARFRSNSPAGTAIARLVGDLSAKSAVSVAFDYRCASLEFGDAVTAQVRPNGSAPWTTLQTFNSCNNSAYTTANFTLASGDWGAATEIQFIVTNAFSGAGADDFYVDNVVISTTGRAPSTYAGAAPPNLTTLTDLLPGETATVTLVTTVNNPYTASDEIDNHVRVQAGNQVAEASVTDCVKCFDTGDDPATFNGAGGTNPARARATSQRNYIADTFQTGNYSGNTGTVDWTGSAWTETGDAATGPGSGLIQNFVDTAASTFALRIGNPGGSTAINTAASRVVGDLSGATTVNLGYDYRCQNMGASDEVQLQVRPNGSSGWTTVQTFNNCNNASIYSNNQVTLSPSVLGTATEMRLVVTNTLETNEIFFFDDVQVRATYDDVTVGPRLGTLFDREILTVSGASPFPATPPGAPTGDDLDGTDDEDGVDVPGIETNTIDVPITVTDAGGGVAYVNGWFDWNNDGVFQINESIFDPSTFDSATGGLTVVGGVGEVPAPGTYTVTLNVPNLETNGSGFAIGDTLYSRFRVATEQTGVISPINASLDGEIEDYSSTLSTLPVSVAHFHSSRAGGSVNVDWRTAQEVDNLGFRLYATGPDGERILLTPDLIVSKAPTSIEAQTYRTTVRTTARELWLEDVSLDGVSEFHGPYTVGQRYGSAAPPEEIDWASANRELRPEIAAERAQDVRQARVDSARRAVAPTAVTGPVARLEVTESGVQQVTYEALASVGVDLAGVPIGYLALTDPSGPVPIEVTGGATFGPGSAIRFLGEPLDTLYTGTNVYRLHIDRSLARRVTLSEAPTTPSSPRDDRRRLDGPTGPTGGATLTEAPVTTYTATATEEQNVSYSVTAPGDDPWYETLMVAFAGSPFTASGHLTLDHVVAGQPAVVTVDAWGITRAPEADEHHVLLSVNGVPVGEYFFDDNDLLHAVADVPAGVLVNGDNTVQLTLLADTGVSIDIIVVDSWALTYQRDAVAVDGRLDLHAAGQQLDVSGMPAGEVLAYRVDAGGSVARVAVTSDGNGITQVPTTGTSQRYVLAAAGAVRTPAVAPMPAAMPLIAGQVDYLMIAPAVLHDALQPLVQYHQSLGRTVKVVEPNDIYEAYSHGVVDAAAIDRYLAAAVPAMDVRWLLLVGADSVDYRDFDHDGSYSLMPSMYGSTGYGITYAPMDPAYGDVDGDGVQDVAMGRMPARTPSELSVLVAKTLAYAAGSSRTAMLASDANGGIDFQAANDTTEAGLAGWAVERSDVDALGATAARNALLAAMQDGTGLVMYLGHSSSLEWTEVGLFDTATASSLSGDPTMVVQFGCWNTYYVSPDADTLAHALLLNPNGGAALVAGSSTLTSSGNDMLMSVHLAAHVDDGDLTIGEAVVLAKQDVARQAGGSTVDVQMGWTILGDPAVVAGGAA